MADIKIKRSSVEGKIPLVSDLQLGELAINTYDGKLFLKRNNGVADYITEVGGNRGFDVKNQTGTTLAKGTLVKFAGTLGSSGKLLVAPFLANGTTPSDYFMGVVLEDIPNGGDGFVVDHGKIYNINTSAYVAGTVLYASATTAGAFSSTQPQAPNNKITVAAVVNSSATAGVLEVRVTLGSQLGRDELVELSGLADGDTLAYNASTARFENTPLKTVNGNSLIGSGNIVISGGDVTLAGTQTLTNKTIDYSNNTLSGVQPTLVSGTSIKTVNSTSLLGSGDLTLFSGGLIKVEVVAALPGSPNANTLYIVTGP